MFICSSFWFQRQDKHGFAVTHKEIPPNYCEESPRAAVPKVQAVDRRLFGSASLKPFCGRDLPDFGNHLQKQRHAMSIERANRTGLTLSMLLDICFDVLNQQVWHTFLGRNFHFCQEMIRWIYGCDRQLKGVCIW
jgi:hypothetical protein